MTLVDVQVCGKGLHELTPDNTDTSGRCRACARTSERRRSNIKAGRHPREILLKVPVAPLRDRYILGVTTGELSPADVARSLEWFCGGRPDTARVRRALGLLPNINHRDGERVETYVTEIEYERAQVLCLALHADPPAMGV